MDTASISDKDRQRIADGVDAWREVHIAAGVEAGAAVHVVGHEGEAMPLEDSAALQQALLGSIEGAGSDDNEDAADWRHDIDVSLWFDNNATALLTLEWSVTPGSPDEVRLTHDGLRVRSASANGDDADPASEREEWCYVLVGEAAAPDSTSTDLVRAAVVAKVLRAAGGDVWAKQIGDRLQFYALVALPRAVSPDQQEDDAIHTLLGCWSPGETRPAHLIRLGELRKRRGEGWIGSIRDDTGFLIAKARKLAALGGDHRLLAALDRLDNERHELRFLVPGFIPTGAVTLLGGAASCGKSTLLHHLAITVATPPAKRSADAFLGVPITTIPHGVAVFLSGEDGLDLLAARREHLAGRDPVAHLIELPPQARDLTEVVQRLRQIPNLKLVVVDPARAYLGGSEDESGPADAFMRPLVELAADTGCAVVVCHHLRKGASPATPGGALEAIRGSQVFVDRPRVVIGAARRGSTVSIGVVKSNYPPSAKMQLAPVQFTLNDETLRLVPVQTSAARQDSRSTSNQDDTVLAVVQAVAEARDAGRRVTRTGQHGVYEMESAILAGLSRSAVRRATQSAIDAGRLRLLVDGRLELATEPLPALPATTATPATTSQNA